MCFTGEFGSLNSTLEQRFSAFFLHYTNLIVLVPQPKHYKTCILQMNEMELTVVCIHSDVNETKLIVPINNIYKKKLNSKENKKYQD